MCVERLENDVTAVVTLRGPPPTPSLFILRVRQGVCMCVHMCGCIGVHACVCVSGAGQTIAVLSLVLPGAISLPAGAAKCAICDSKQHSFWAFVLINMDL